jgi:hypothetical protein
MRKRILRNARVRVGPRTERDRRVQRQLAHLEQRVYVQEQRLNMERAIRLHEIQRTNFSVSSFVGPSDQTQRVAELAAAAVSAVNFSYSATGTGDLPREKASASKFSRLRRMTRGATVGAVTVYFLVALLGWVVGHVD